MDVTRGARQRLLWGAGIALIALGAGALFATQASAQEAEIRLGRVTVAVGEEGTVRLRAVDIGAPGLGAWQIGVLYDDSVVDPVDCDAKPIGSNYCNPDFEDGRVEIVGAAAQGQEGGIALANITFRCIDDGNIGLKVVLDEFADATEGAPEAIDADIVHGAIACVRPDEFDLGDVDCDGDVDSRDAALVLQYEAGLIRSLPCQHVADVNRDGDIDSVDAALILQFEAGLIDSLPAGEVRPALFLRSLF